MSTIVLYTGPAPTHTPGGSLVLYAKPDNQLYIKTDTGDETVIVNSATPAAITSQDIMPDANLAYDIGASGLAYRDVHAQTFHGSVVGGTGAFSSVSTTGGASFGGNVIVGGNLTVNGTTTTINTETIALADNVVVLNSNFTSGTPTEDAGISISRGSDPSVSLIWDEALDAWMVTTDGAVFSRLWHEGNDGAGSTLEADTVDGYHASAFSLVGHTHTSSGITDFSDAAKDAAGSMLTGGTHTNISTVYNGLTHTVNISVLGGTGSGLDADTLDGQHGAFYAPINSPSFTGTPTLPTGTTGATQTSGDSSTKLATTAFVQDAVSTAVGGISSNSITQGNSSVTVTDTGANGQVVVSTEGNARLTIDSAGLATFAQGVVVQGNLTVSGTTTTVNSTQLNVGDNLITLNANVTGTPTLDAGFEVKRGSSPTARLYWDETNDDWRVTPDNGSSVYKLWHGGNDGTGSGLDADYVRGATPNTSAVAYSLVQRNVNGEINAASNMFIDGNKVWHLGNDGAGSGLDADTLDGNQAAAFALLSGATMTGQLNLKTFTEAKITANSGTAYTLDCAVGTVWNITLTGNVTFSFANVPATANSVTSITLFLTQDATGGRTRTFPASVKWAGGTVPTWTTTANKTDIVSLVTPDNGANWYGFVGGLSF
jgi:hypothetical protein